ncbi:MULTISPECIES: energy-coupling factor transporter transmembrane protein EcfT [Anaerolinea]|uniref:energy-coupling factor transporter transmembrane component T family protein n=1 Tax=Anaerolinea TaxID=233189 RepID=UPI002602F20A|nr:energy-coupling factor transporter transmembrane component T [Anaerolinea thermophila]
MIANFGYRPHQSILEKIDPRARWIFAFCMLFSIVLFWDLRILSVFFVITLIQFFVSKVTWQETKRAWIFILVLSSIMIFINTIITGVETVGGTIRGGTPLFSLKIPLFETFYVLTVERLWFALTQYLRIISIASLFIILPFTMDPRLYGVTFKGLGFPDKLAYTMDLAFRFIPTIARDFNVTLDAQRARGFEIDKGKMNIFQRIRRMAPLMVPVTMNSILAGEDIANAMDLRCFGLKKRSWIENLHFKTGDFVLIGFSILILVVSLYLRFGLNLGDFWMPGMS